MRLGRVPLLGIDYGPSPASGFRSSGAKGFASQGQLKAAYAYEKLCDLVQDTPDESDGLYYGWTQRVQEALRVFGSSGPEIMESVQIECDPDYVQGDLEVPTEPARYVPPPYRQPQASVYQSPSSSSGTPYRIPSGFSWNQMLSPFGSMWT